MLVWMLRTWFARLLGYPLELDARGRYITPGGEPYVILVEEQPGKLGIATVTLLGEDTIADTQLPGLRLRVRATPLRVEAAIRLLLRRADEQTARARMFREQYPSTPTGDAPPTKLGSSDIEAVALRVAELLKEEDE